jgi:DNA anti-recombination protein RmuC
MEYIEKLNEMGLANVFMGIVLLAVCCEFLIEVADKLLTKFGIETKWSLKKKAMEKEILSLREELNRLKKEHTDDRDKFIEGQNCINESLNHLKEDIQSLTETTQKIQEDNNSKDRAKLKDRISQAYRHYHQTQKWTKMEKESFVGLVKSYELCGGINSFVHTVCEPESQTWEITDEDD